MTSTSPDPQAFEIQFRLSDNRTVTVRAPAVRPSAVPSASGAEQPPIAFQMLDSRPRCCASLRSPPTNSSPLALTIRRS